ncbi:hypothetical protein [Haloarchaeobius sp. HRN-SO-5]|uniref:hypothetical protein n=1 Tax=Haloarchaeobius sp. HRN-SO-5 TaxID=3446118 RepID=UPI003EBE9CA2
MDGDDRVVEHAVAQLDCDEATARGFLDELDAAVGSVCPLCGEGYIVGTDDDRLYPSRGRQERSVNLGVVELSLSKSRELREPDEAGAVDAYTCTSENDLETCALAGRFSEQVVVETVRGIDETERAVERRRAYVADRLARAEDRL